MSTRSLDNRSAIVTGGASGQGRAIAIALAAHGANVAVGSFIAGKEQRPLGETYYPDEEALEETVSQICSHSVKGLGQHHNACSNESCDALYQAALSAFGHIDILCNVAGVYIEHPVCGHDDATWDHIIDVNLNGYYRMTKRCLPDMIANGWGRIVNIASTAANVGHPHNAAYCASKAAILGLTRCVALEGAPHGVTCNAINPGYVDTGMLRNSLATSIDPDIKNRTHEDLIQDIKDSYPQNRLIEPEEIANLAVFLCHQDALGITMENIDVAGGSLW